MPNSTILGECFVQLVLSEFSFINQHCDFLQNDYQFNDNPKYERLVKIFSYGTATKNEVELINSWLLIDGVGNGVTQKIPKEIITDTYYTCACKTEINSVTTIICSYYVNDKHQKHDSNADFT